MTNKQHDFLRSVFLSNALQGAFQRANVYAKGTDTKEFREEREKFVARFQERLRALEDIYRATVSEDEHYQNINAFAEAFSAKHRKVLTDGQLRIGIAQKAVNLYLKYLWCAGWVERPPHCPVDGIILGKVDIRDVRWTTDIVTIEDYRKIIEKIKEKIGDKNLADWELETYPG